MSDKKLLMEELEYCANEIEDLSTLYLKTFGKTLFYQDLEEMTSNLRNKKIKIEEGTKHD